MSWSPETCGYVTLLGKKHFVVAIKLKISWWGDYVGLSRWVQCNYNSLYKRKREEGEPEKEMWQRKQRWGIIDRAGKARKRLEDALLLALKMEEGATNQGMLVVAEKARNEFCPQWSLQEECSPADVLNIGLLSAHLGSTYTKIGLLSSRTGR